LVPPGYFLFWLLALFLVRRRLTLYYALSQEAHDDIQNGQLAFIGAAAFAMFMFMFVALVLDQPVWGAAAAILLFTSPLFGRRKRRTFRVELIEGGRAFLKVDPKVFDALGLSPDEASRLSLGRRAGA
jgi:hypothetical protein